jgi:hypothetical protein
MLTRFPEKKFSVLVSLGSREISVSFTGQIAFSHQIQIYLSGGFPAFADGPNHQGLSAPHVARRKNI